MTLPLTAPSAIWLATPIAEALVAVYVAIMIVRYAKKPTPDDEKASIASTE